MNIIDRVIGWVSPERAFKRAKYRNALRLYEGAQVGRRASSWRGRGTSANAEIADGMKRLRDRARELVRNTPHAPRILDIIINNTVGEGVIPQPNTGNDKLDDKVSALWDSWQEHCDVQGYETFYGMQVLGLRSIIEGGETVVRYVNRKPSDMPDGAQVPLQLQLLEGDHIDEGRDGLVSGMGPNAPERSRLGVGMGDFDAPTGLWIHPQHPGEITIHPGMATLQSKFIPENELLHLFLRGRPGQIRGVTWFAPMMQIARDNADFMDSVNVKARAEACFVAFIEQLDEEQLMDPGATPQGESANNPDAMTSTLEPGMIKLLKPGQKISFGQPSGTTQAESVMMFSLMAMAASLGVTYDQLSGDLRGANYSSLRAGKLEFKRQCSRLQQTFFIPRFCNRVWNRWITQAILAGVLKERKGGYPVEWVTPAWESVNPKLDLAAEENAVRSGRWTPQEFIGSWGGNWRKTLRDRQKYYAYADELKVQVDMDSRRFTRAGLKQVVQPDQPAPAPGVGAPGDAAGGVAGGGATAAPSVSAVNVTLVDGDGNPIDMEAIEAAAAAADEG